LKCPKCGKRMKHPSGSHNYKCEKCWKIYPVNYLCVYQLRDYPNAIEVRFDGFSSFDDAIKCIELYVRRKEVSGNEVIATYLE